MLLDQFSVGQVFSTRTYRMTLADIQRFAAEFDPEYMHLDADKAAAGRFNGIIASGMHTLAVTFKLWVEEGHYGDEVIAGKQVDNVRFVRPVFPDDILHVSGIVTESRATKPGQGILTVKLTTRNQHEEIVLETEISAVLKCAANLLS